MARGMRRQGPVDRFDEAVGEDTSVLRSLLGGAIPEAMDADFATSRTKHKAERRERGQEVGKNALMALMALILPAVLPGGAAYGAAGGLGRQMGLPGGAAALEKLRGLGPVPKYNPQGPGMPGPTGFQLARGQRPPTGAGMAADRLRPRPVPAPRAGEAGSRAYWDQPQPGRYPGGPQTLGQQSLMREGMPGFRPSPADMAGATGKQIAGVESPAMNHMINEIRALGSLPRQLTRMEASRLEALRKELEVFGQVGRTPQNMSQYFRETAGQNLSDPRTFFAQGHRGG